MNIKITDKELLDCLYEIFDLSIQIDVKQPFLDSEGFHPDKEGHDTIKLARLKYWCQRYLERPLIKALNENI